MYIWLMDDNGGNIAYYIVLGIIYLLSRVFGKKKKKPVKKGTVSRPAPRQDESPGPIAPPTAEKEEAPVSFEDLLRELAGARQPKPEAVPEPGPVVPADTFSDPGSLAVDEMDKIAGDLEVPEPIAAKPIIKVDRDKEREKYRLLKFERDEDYRIEEEVGIDFLEVLQQEDGPVKAVVMAEIFNRKY